MNLRLIFRVFLLGLLPVAALQAALFPLWLLLEMQQQQMPSTNWFLVDLPVYQLLITGIAIPIFLCIVGVRLTHTTTPNEALLTSLLLVLFFLIGLLLDYSNWAITGGSFRHPDDETVMIEVGKGGLGLILMITTFVVTLAMRFAPRLYRRYAKSGV